MTTATDVKNPMHDMIEAVNGVNPWLGAWMAEGWKFQERLAAMPKVVEAARNAKKWATPFDVVMTEGPVRLLRFRGKAEPKHATPLLFVFAMVNRPYVLDILPHKSVVRQFLNKGFDVYMVDWGVPTQADRNKTMHDYIEGNLHSIVKRVLALTGQPSLNLFGYCMGGTMSAMYASLHQDLVKNFIALAAPFDWSQGDALLKVWTNEENFDVDKIVDTLGLIPPDFLGTSFNLLRPVDNNVRKWMGFYEKMTDEKFLEEFFAMEMWVNDNIPISGAVYRDFVKYGLQRNLLVQGKFPLGPHMIDLKDVTCPVLNIVADADHLVPCGQSLPLKDVVGSDDYQLLSTKAGHIGLAVGTKAHKEMWPAAAEWLAERSTPVSAAKR
jgi:polyhydroxyalkanoate synthase subunit PhaC